MKEIRIHGRGGQGCVTAGLLIAEAFFQSGKWAQTFPIFGVERRGAPVAAFVRVGDDPILQRYNIYKPHHVLVADATLVKVVNVVEGLRKDGRIFLNTAWDYDKIGGEGGPVVDIEGFKVHPINATGIALHWKLGTEQAPIVNTALVGFYLRICGVALEHGLTAVEKHIPVKVEANKNALADAYHYDMIEDEPWIT